MSTQETPEQAEGVKDFDLNAVMYDIGHATARLMGAVTEAEQSKWEGILAELTLALSARVIELEGRIEFAGLEDYF